MRRLGYIAAGLWIAGLNFVERRHGSRTRSWNAGHHGALTTKKPKP